MIFKGSTPSSSPGHPTLSAGRVAAAIGGLLLAFLLCVLLGLFVFSTTDTALCDPIGIHEVNAVNARQYLETSCSPRAFLSGGKKKVLGYIFYEDNQTTLAATRKYFEGVHLNAHVNQVSSIE